jgi:hypothetical protein
MYRLVNQYWVSFTVSFCAGDMFFSVPARLAYAGGNESCVTYPRDNFYLLNKINTVVSVAVDIFQMTLPLRLTVTMKPPLLDYDNVVPLHTIMCDYIIVHNIIIIIFFIYFNCAYA